MDKWIDYEFESSSSLTPEFKQFYMDFRKHMNKAAKAVGMEITAWSRGHFEVSGFFKNPETGKFAYFSIADVRYFPNEWLNSILIRTATDTKDYRGGVNQSASLPFVAAKALELTK